MPDDSSAALPLPSASPAFEPGGTVRLTDWGVIRATGADAAAFLHGQLTQDALHLQADGARLAGYCSAKGRLLATFVMWRRGPDELVLACSADLLPATLKRLSMFVMRAKCRLSDASEELRLWGRIGAAAAGAPGAVWGLARDEHADIVRLPAAVVDGVVVERALALQTAAVDDPAPASASAAARGNLTPEAWRYLEVRSGVARVVAATTDLFVPQMVNLELVGGVDFQKGCYPGQEVVARSQYRGTVKRRASILEGPEAMQPGQELFHSADPDQPAGTVALAGSCNGRHAALAQLKTAALVGGTLHLGSAQGVVLHHAALPYAMPAEAA